MKTLLYDLAYEGLDGHRPWLWLRKFIPNRWGYLGPTEASYKPRPAPWLFCGDHGFYTLIAVLAFVIVLINA